LGVARCAITVRSAASRSTGRCDSAHKANASISSSHGSTSAAFVMESRSAAAVVIVATAPALPTSSQESDFLPGHYESIQALVCRRRRSGASRG
jgi:hypothetical protein